MSLFFYTQMEVQILIDWLSLKYFVGFFLCSDPFSLEATKHLKDQMRKAVFNHIWPVRLDATEGKIFSKYFICLCTARLKSI